MPCSPGTQPVILATPMVYGNQGQKTKACLKAGLAISWLHVLGQPLLSLGLGCFRGLGPCAALPFPPAPSVPSSLLSWFQARGPALASPRL